MANKIKDKMKNLALIISLCTMTSCVYHSGLITSTPVSNVDKNCEYVDIAVGYSNVSYFFGIGGFNKDAFLNEAKRNLYFSYPIKNGQSFDNMTLDLKTTCFWPYRKVEAIIIADVIERDTSFKTSYGKNYMDLLTKNNSKTKNFLNVSERIVYLDEDNNLFKGKIIKLNNNNATIFFIDNNGTLQIKNIEYKCIFKASQLDELQSKVGYKKDDKIKFIYKYSNTQSETLEGIIIGLNIESVLIKTAKSITSVKYSNLKKN